MDRLPIIIDLINWFDYPYAHSMEELLKSSDRLMYSAKQNGGNRFAI